MPRKATTKKTAAVATKKGSTGAEAGIYQKPNDYGNWGEFIQQNLWRSWAGLQEPETRISQYDRLDRIQHSRNFEANISEVAAIISLFGELVIGDGLQPMFKGADKVWGENAKNWLKTVVFPRFGPFGIQTDWNTTWKMVFKRVYIDGGILMFLYPDRLGLPHADFVEVSQVRNKNSQTVISGGRFDGYTVEDGIIKGKNGSTPIGVQVCYEDETLDTTYSVNEAFLITFEPASFGKFHGIPVLSSAVLDGYHIMDFRKLISQIVKVPATVQLVETNETGKAKKVPNSFKAIPQTTQANCNNSQNGSQPAFIVGTINELMQPGKHYQKPGAKLEMLKNNSPAEEIQSYINAVYKSFFSKSGYSYHFLIAPEEIGGAASRGVQDQMNRTVAGFQMALEKYAMLALVYCLSIGIVNGFVPVNVDWMKWKFSRCAKLVLDASYERQADRDDNEAGLLPNNDITTKNSGQQYSEVVQQYVLDDVAEAEGLDAVIAECKARKLSDVATQYAIDRYKNRNNGSNGGIGPPPPPDPAPVKPKK